MRVVVVRFPNGEWSYGGKLSSPEYTECDRWLIPIPDRFSDEYALKIVQKMTPAQREIMKRFVDEDCLNTRLTCNISKMRTLKSLDKKRLISIDDQKQKSVYVYLN
jgi:hypothetical protein